MTINPLLTLCTSALLVSCSSQVTTNTGDLNVAEKASIQQCKNNLPSSKKIKLQAVSAGCLASVALSKALGQNNPAALICLAGGAAGFMLGSSISERKCGYISAEKQIQSELAHTQKINANFANLFIKQEKNIRQLDTQAAHLVSQQRQGEDRQRALQKLQRQIASSITKENKLLKQFTEEAQFKSQTTRISPTQTKHVSQATRNSLIAEVKTLQKSIYRMRLNQNVLENINQLVTASLQ